MCGIAGFVSRTDQSVERSTITQMTQAVAHRGPDGQGIYVNGKVALGHRRLAIIDLSEAGAEPMERPSSGNLIVFNGEIYNYLELRAELQALGYAFHTQTDTEVILAAYECWGTDCVSRFNGMWAFAIYDATQGIVFCSRDRFGVKPFYYLDHPDFFAFGSEIRQLLPLFEQRKADRQVLLDYLCFAVTERGNESFFAGIRRLAAGSSLVFRVATGGYEIKRHYRLPASSDHNGNGAPTAAQSFRDLFKDSVKLRLRSDVLVGTCLSGGLDSSSVAAVAADLNRAKNNGRFAAVTAGSEDPANDESAFAQQVVDQAGLQWHRIKPDFSDFADTLAEVVRAQEEPFASPSVCMQFFVMREARKQGLVVLLDGQGGDETLLGYDRYGISHVKDVYQREGLGAALKAARTLAHNNAKLSLFKQLALLVYFSSPGLRWLNYRWRMRGVSTFPSLDHFRRRYGRPLSSLRQVQAREIEEEIIPHLLRYEDKNSMWHAVETRLPFLDYRLVEYALDLPAEAKIADGWTKLTLRQAMAGMLPDTVLWRKRKIGFEAPDKVWLPKLREQMLSVVKASPLLRELFGGPVNANKFSAAVLWRFAVAALWEKEFKVSGIEDRSLRRGWSAALQPARRTRQVCTKCVMDGSDSEIEFDDAGVCNHCRDFEARTRTTWFPDAEGAERLRVLVDRVKAAGQGKRYDSILGLSGGVDSSYLALKLHSWGLRPLVVHVDAGWNSELAVANIEKIVKYCNFDLHTHVVDWEEMRDLQLAYLRAGVANQDVPQDHVFFASLYHFAIESGIRTIFSGGNIATEAIYPSSWGEWNAMDARNLRAIHARYGRRKLKTYRTIGFTDYYVRFPFLHGMRTLRPLNYMPYDKATAIKELEQTIGWRAYDRKHGESLFTRFFQNYYLPVRFGYDKRRPHYSSLIVSGQMQREDALARLEDPISTPDELESDVAFFIKKMRITRAEFDELMAAPIRDHQEFPTQVYMHGVFQGMKRLYERVTGKTLRVYS
jgi:asparagine synthase (glutamine-hydrolysing)